ncbi:MAG: Gldg family protein [Candidatus Omnitrophica bacterium]|nr:Gldg family protein [Candidatus Omnitrophota bacterium]
MTFSKVSPILTVFRRETAAYFNSSIAYIFIIVFVVLNGGFFMNTFFLIGRADMRSFFSLLPFFLAIFLPAVTMRLWAEERRGNTLELLLTFPMRTEELVIGKFLASAMFYASALAATFSIPLMIYILGRPDLGAMAGGYAGAFLLGAFFLAVGIFISGLCRDQIVAFILTMMICFGLRLLGNNLVAATIDGWIPGLGTWLDHFVGCLSHYESFTRGVIDLKDVLYFVIGAAVFLVLNGFWLEGRMRPRAALIFSSAVVISTGIFLMSNWLLAGTPLGRFDLTEGKVYTISGATKKILRDLKAPVTVKLYISPTEKMPGGMKTLERDILDKFDELKIISEGKFQYKIFHPENIAIPSPGESEPGKESLEEQISNKGIQPFRIESIEADQVGVRLVYAAISLAYKEKPEEIIHRIIPETLTQLEYLIMSKIYRLTLPETPKLALVAPYEDKETDPQLRALLSQLGAQVPQGYRQDLYEFLPVMMQYEGYTMERIRLTESEPIPAGTKTLIVIEPRTLSERQQYEINRFLAQGGSLFLAVQNYEYEYRAGGNELGLFPFKKYPAVNPMLKEWGFEVDEKILGDEQNDILNVASGAGLGIIPMAVPVKLPIQILIPTSQFNPDISITSHLPPMFYLWGTALKLDSDKIKSQALKVQTLFGSSPQSWTIPFSEGPLMAAVFEKQADSETGPFPLAVMAEGQFKNIYEGKPAPEWDVKQEPEVPEDKQEKAESLTLAPGKMILTGAASMFQKRLIQNGGHADFFMNSLDILTLGGELISIRSKQPADRSLKMVPRAAKFGWRFATTLLIPIVIAILGAFRILFRQNLKQSRRKSLTSAGV